jgi:FAD/FMN-containing dehydrogenase
MSIAEEIEDALDALEHDAGEVARVLEHWKKDPDAFALAAEDRLKRLFGDETSAPPALRRVSWENYAGNQIVAPLSLVAPTSLDELRTVILDAAARSQRVKAVGSGHSASDIVQTTGVLVDTHNLSGLLDDDAALYRAGVDATTLVHVLGGTRLDDLNEALWDRGLALANLGAFDGQTIAGAVATSTHGSGISLGALSSAVVSIELLTPDGTLRRVEPSAGVTDPVAFASARKQVKLVQDDAEFYASVVHLGCLGVVYALTLRVVPRYWLAETRRLGDWSRVRGLLATGAILRESRHLEVLLNPYPRDDGDHTCLVTRRVLVPEPTSPGRAGGHRQFLPALISGSRVAEALFITFLNAWPSLTPSLIDEALETLVDGDGPDGPYVDRGYMVLNLGPVNAQPALSTEIAFSMDRYLDAVDRIFALADEARVAGDIYQSSPVSLRFVAGSPHALAMQYGADPACMIEMPVLPGTHGAMSILTRYEDAMRAFAGRPHWGEMNAVSAAEVRALYPKLDDFLAIRAKLDPSGMFSNAFTGRAAL